MIGARTRRRSRGGGDGGSGQARRGARPCRGRARRRADHAHLGRVTLVRRCAWNEQSNGRDEVREHYEELLTSFRDLAIDVKARHVTDDAVILEVVVSGTHLGPWRDLPPLERWMESRVCAVYTFDEQGLLELERTYYDKAEVLEQLGIFKDPRKPLGRVLAVLTPPFATVRAFVKRLFRRS